MNRKLLVTGDDRTGCLEIGGVLASQDFHVPVGPNADDPGVCVVDIDSRHVRPPEAAERMFAIHQRQASARCHKMDSGLRGNWPHEVRALVELGHRVAVVPSYPDAGRVCREGVVYIHDVLLLDSPFGADPLSAPCSNKPVDVLKEAGCLFDEVEVWDAVSNEQLELAVKRSMQDERVLVGPTGAIEMYGRLLFPHSAKQTATPKKPILVASGSLNSVSREQIARLGANRVHITGSEKLVESVSVLETPLPDASISISDAKEMSQRMNRRILELLDQFNSLIVIGGDTVGALIGDSTVHAMGTVATGIPACLFQDKLLITKGGGIGLPDTLEKMIASSEESA